MTLSLQVNNARAQFNEILKTFARFSDLHFNSGIDPPLASSANLTAESGYAAPPASPSSDDDTDDDDTKTQDLMDARENETVKPTLVRSTASASAFFPFRKPHHHAGKRERSSKPREFADCTISNISEIAKLPDVSIREQNSKCADSGPLQSTFQYPQHSTPEKPVDQAAGPGEQSAVHKLTLLDGTERPIANAIDSRMESHSDTSAAAAENRNAPQGLDNACFTPMKSPAAKGLARKTQTNEQDSPTSITPLIRRALQANPNFNRLFNSPAESDSATSPTIVADSNATPTSSASKTLKASRDKFLDTNETFGFPSRKLNLESDGSDESGEEQPQTDLKHLKRRSGPYMRSDGKLVHHYDSPAIPRLSTVHGSTGFRRFQSGDNGPGTQNSSSDLGPSAHSQHSGTTSTSDSSFKESDGQHSPRSGRVVYIPKLRDRPRKLYAASSSGASSSRTVPLGFVAPRNSPNVTADSKAYNKPSTSDVTDPSDLFLNSGPWVLPERPPCMGAEIQTPPLSKVSSATPGSSSAPSTVKRQRPRRAGSFSSPKTPPMALLEPRAQTDCDSSSEKSDTLSGQETNRSREHKKGKQSSSSSRSTEDSTKSPAKKSKRRLSQKLQLLKNRFRRKPKHAADDS